MTMQMSPIGAGDTIKGHPAMTWIQNQIARMARVLRAKSPTFDSKSTAGGRRELLWQPIRVSVTTDGAGVAIITFPDPFPTEAICVVFSGQAATYVRRTTLTKTAFGIVGPVGATFEVDYIAVGF